MTSHVVLLEKDVPDLIPLLARDGARALGLPMADFTRLLRRSRGILGPLSEDDALRIKDLLSERGHRAKAVLDADLPPDLPAEALLDADPMPRGFLLQNIAGGDPDLVPWDLVEILVVGIVTFKRDEQDREKRPHESRDEASGLMRNLLGIALPVAPALPESRPTPTPREETFPCLDIVLREPAARYRVVSSRFVYDYLGERMDLTSVLNFRTLITDLATQAPEALLSRSTLAYLEGANQREFRFSDAEAFERYVLWLRAWRGVFE